MNDEPHVALVYAQTEGCRVSDNLARPPEEDGPTYGGTDYFHPALAPLSMKHFLPSVRHVGMVHACLDLAFA